MLGSDEFPFGAKRPIFRGFCIFCFREWLPITSIQAQPHQWLCGPRNAWWVCWPYGVEMTWPIAWDLPLPLEVLGKGWMGLNRLQTKMEMMNGRVDDEISELLNMFFVFDIVFMHFNYCHPCKAKLTIKSKAYESDLLGHSQREHKQSPFFTDEVLRACDECPRIWVNFEHFIGNRALTLPKTNSSPLTIGHPKRKRSSSNLPFSWC